MWGRSRKRENTPGVLRLLLKPEAFPKLTAPLASLRCNPPWRKFRLHFLAG